MDKQERIQFTKRVIEHVSAVRDVKISDLLCSDYSLRHVILARSIIFLILRAHLSYLEIGKIFSGRPSYNIRRTIAVLERKRARNAILDSDINELFRYLNVPQEMCDA